MTEFIPPELHKDAFNCPSCGAYSEQIWSAISAGYKEKMANNTFKEGRYSIPGFAIAKCRRCEAHSYWLKNQMIFPLSGAVPPPIEDMPQNVKDDYNEAKSIVNLSPRGAAALLRLAVQKLCKHLGESGENINEDIKSLVSKGLPVTLQQALDSVRVIGNNAVHPGQIDIKDDPETAIKLFGFINIIVDMRITQPKKINEFYTLKLPESTKEGIAKRDGSLPLTKK